MSSSRIPSAAVTSAILKRTSALSLACLTFGTMTCCSQSDVSMKRDGSSAESSDSTAAREVEIPISFGQEGAADGLNLAGNRLSYAKMVVHYSVGTSPKMRAVEVGYDVRKNPPVPLPSPSIRGPLGALITVTGVHLIDFKTNNAAEPAFLGLSDKVVPDTPAAPLVLSAPLHSKLFTFSITRKSIAPVKITDPATPINLTYAVEYKMADCLEDGARAPNGQGTNCTGDDSGFGSSEGVSTLATGAAEGVGAPQATWNRADSKVLAVNDANSTPPYGTVLIALDCRGSECPTHLRESNPIGHRFYTGPKQATQVPTALGASTFKLLDSAKAVVKNPLLATTQSPNGMFQVQITLEKVALQRPAVASPFYRNDFEINLERRDGGKTGSSTLILIQKPAYFPNP